jgi:Holliday junction resolvasome RuvABC ATP-dependent DNA helicase subunit
LTHGWLNTNTILSVFFCVGRPERFGEHSVQHELLATQFAAKPVGLSTLAVAIGEEPDTIEAVIEPYLIRIGFIQRTPRGREITQSGILHISSN